MISLYSMNINQDQPTMKAWTNAWHNSDAQALTALYAANASVFPPKKQTLIGNETIVNYFKGGFGKVDIYFEPTLLEVDENMAYEFGEFKDVKWGTKELTEKGKYSITWIKFNEEWKILCHVFSIGDNG
ncbi:MAG: nuclear transport factor 2 family protein [Bacteroidota bacterium]